MSFEHAAKNLTENAYQNLKQSLQLGKWPDGNPLSRKQKEICMDAIITYELANGIPEKERIGYLDRDRLKPCSSKAAGIARIPKIPSRKIV